MFTFPVGMHEKATAGSQTFTSLGAMSFTVPAGVYTLKVTMAAGGGGGSGMNNGPGNYGPGGGGGGGYSQQSYAVTPGQVINGSVGAGGSAGGYSSSGGNGQDTTFGTLTATAGTGGIYGSWQAGTGGTPGGSNGGAVNVGYGGASGAGQGAQRDPPAENQPAIDGNLYGGGGHGGHANSVPNPSAGAHGWIKVEWD